LTGRAFAGVLKRGRSKLEGKTALKVTRGGISLSETKKGGKKIRT